MQFVNGERICIFLAWGEWWKYCDGEQHEWSSGDNGQQTQILLGDKVCSHCTCRGFQTRTQADGAQEQDKNSSGTFIFYAITLLLRRWKMPGPRVHKLIRPVSCSCSQYLIPEIYHSFALALSPLSSVQCRAQDQCLTTSKVFNLKKFTCFDYTIVMHLFIIICFGGIPYFRSKGTSFRFQKAKRHLTSHFFYISSLLCADFGREVWAVPEPSWLFG